MHIACMYAKSSFIEDIHHRLPGARQRHHIRIAFHTSNQTIISSRIIRSQIEGTNDRVALAVFMYILNILIELTKFIYNGGSISRRNLTITLSIYHL